MQTIELVAIIANHVVVLPLVRVRCILTPGGLRGTGARCSVSLGAAVVQGAFAVCSAAAVRAIGLRNAFFSAFCVNHFVEFLAVRCLMLINEELLGLMVLTMLVMLQLKN